MAAVKDLLMRYCETVHPDSWDKQDELFEEIMTNGGPSLEEMAMAVKKFDESGKVPEQPALTLHRVCAALGIK